MTFNEYNIERKTMPMLDDKTLVKRVLEGDKDAMAQFLAEKCFNTFSYICNQRLKCLDLEINDLINDFYIYLSNNDWKVLRTFRFESKLQTWVNWVASRYLVKLYRKDLKENAKETPPITEKTLFDITPNETKMSKFELMDSINKLENTKDREILRYTLLDMKTEEIAKLMATSNGNVYIMRNRAVNNLKRLLNENN